MSDPLVIIGNGMAATRLVEQLCSDALGRYAIAVIGEEPRLAYNRVMLSSVLANECTDTDIELRPADWWRARGVTLRYGCGVERVDLSAKTIQLADKRSLPFSKLVFATGSEPLKPRIGGAELPGVHTFRDTRDVARLRAIKRNAPIIVIGGGLLGIEAASGLAKLGARVTLVHLMDRLMERQLDPIAAEYLRCSIEERGIDIILSAESNHIAGRRRAAGLVLKSGRILDAEMVVIATGIQPRAGLARAAGLNTNRGIVVDDCLQTSAKDVFAIGECAEHRSQCYGLVEPAYDQARILAKRLGGQDALYNGSVLATNLKVSGVHVFSAGDFMGAPGSEQIIFTDKGLGTYKKLVIANGRLIGAVLFGDTKDGLWYLDLIRSGVSIEAFRSDLIFGRALAVPVAA